MGLALRYSICGWALAALSVGQWGRAQGDPRDPVRLNELRAAYQKDVATAIRPQAQRFREELVKLERTLVAARDYRQAAAVRDERLKVEKRLAQAARDSGPPAQAYPGGPVTLTAKDAIAAGGVAYNAAKDALDGWKSTGSSARWTLPFPLKAGGYEVIVEMACAPGSGGQVTVKEDFHTLTKAIAPTNGWDDFGSQTLGTLRVRANSTNLNLGAITVEGDGLFLLRCVKLVPVSSSE